MAAYREREAQLPAHHWRFHRVHDARRTGLTTHAVSEAAHITSRGATRRRKGDHPMPHQHISKACHNAHRHARSAPGAAHHQRPRGGIVAPAHHADDRERIVAILSAASRVLLTNPDAVALLLDGALSQMLALWAQAAHIRLRDRSQALGLLDAAAPAIAWRLRLALQAHAPEARLGHCWALLELLTHQTAPDRADGAYISRISYGSDNPGVAQDDACRKDRQSHVS